MYFFAKMVVMLEFRFLLVNFHFIINLLAALVCFSCAWLYFDAWLIKKDYREGTKLLGFFFLSVAFVVNSTIIESSILEQPVLGSATLRLISDFMKAIGYIVLIVGQIIDPLQPLPEYRKKTAAAAIVGAGSFPLLQLIPFAFPILATLTAFLYLRRATVGLEHHLKPISWSFFMLAVKEVVGIAVVFRETDNIDVLRLVEAYGPLWILELLLLVAAMSILGKWVWSYLVKRLETQLFIIFTTGILAVFLVTAVFFTSVSISNLREDILGNLEINAKVLDYGIDSKKAEVLSDARVISQNSEIIVATKDQNRKDLAAITSDLLKTKKQSLLTIVDENGVILMRADDPEKTGGSLSSDELVSQALANEAVSDIISKEGVMAPEISVRAASPIFADGGELVGAVILGVKIDNAFLDGLKTATGLDASVYSGSVRSATTFIAPDGKSRWVGIEESSDQVTETVLDKGELYSGDTTILNTPYLASYLPILDIDEEPIGMLFVGRTQISTLQSASKLIEQTFLVTTVLLVLSILPAFMVSKYIIDQI